MRLVEGRRHSVHDRDVHLSGVKKYPPLSRARRLSAGARFLIGFAAGCVLLAGPLRANGDDVKIEGKIVIGGLPLLGPVVFGGGASLSPDGENKMKTDLFPVLTLGSISDVVEWQKPPEYIEVTFIATKTLLKSKELDLAADFGTTWRLQKRDEGVDSDGRFFAYARATGYVTENLALEAFGGPQFDGQEGSWAAGMNVIWRIDPGWTPFLQRDDSLDVPDNAVPAALSLMSDYTGEAAPSGSGGDVLEDASFAPLQAAVPYRYRVSSATMEFSFQREVPEPATYGLCAGLILIALGVVRRIRRARDASDSR
jgi:hypothetical protein